MPKQIFAIGTMDTKGEELSYLAEQIRLAGGSVLVVDVGTAAAPTARPDIFREKIADHHPDGRSAVLRLADRAEAVAAMGIALEHFLKAEHSRGEVAGVIGIGGSGGTALIAPALRALPIGIPKLMVSTIASGNVAPYIGCCDITMMYSVVDLAGLNRVSQAVLTNAARAIVGMTRHELLRFDETRPNVAMTMFGVTTPCVTLVRRLLEESGYECLVFHATGTGGQAMEKLVASGMIDGVLDITTTEVADEVVGGILSAGPHRFDIILERGIPYVLSLGALDMVNFGARDTVPNKFRDRRLHAHNAQVTLMRSSPAENREFARWIARKINRSHAPVSLLIPEKGVSSLDAPGQPFFDPKADRTLFDELEAAIVQTSTRRILRLQYHINDPEFASSLVATYLNLESATHT